MASLGDSHWPVSPDTSTGPISPQWPLGWLQPAFEYPHSPTSPAGSCCHPGLSLKARGPISARVPLGMFARLSVP